MIDRIQRTWPGKYQIHQRLAISRSNQEPSRMKLYHIANLNTSRSVYISYGNRSCGPDVKWTKSSLLFHRKSSSGVSLSNARAPLGLIMNILVSGSVSVGKTQGHPRSRFLGLVNTAYILLSTSLCSRRVNLDLLLHPSGSGSVTVPVFRTAMKLKFLFCLQGYECR